MYTSCPFPDTHPTSYYTAGCKREFNWDNALSPISLEIT